MDEKQDENEPAARENDDTSVAPEGLEAQADVMLEGARQQRENDTQSTRNKLLVALLVIIIGVSGAYLVLSGGDSTDDSQEAINTQELEIASDTEPAETAQDRFNQVVYAHSSTDNAPQALFSRPVAGGDRVDESFSFSPDPLDVDRDGTHYVASENGKVFYSNGANKPRVIFETTDEIFDLKLDARNQSVAVSTFTGFEDPNLRVGVTIVNTETAASEIFIDEAYSINGSSSGGYILFHWDGASQTLLADTVKIATSDFPNTIIRITKDGVRENLHTGQGVTDSLLNFSRDGSQAVFVRAETNFTSQQIAEFKLDGIFGPSGPPFKIVVLDVESGNETTIATIGSLDEWNEDSRRPIVGWADFGGPERVAYAYENKLFVQDGQGGFSNYFETESLVITSIIAIDEDELLVGATLPEGGERIFYFNIDTQEGAVVMETTINTNLLSVTLQ